MTIEKKLDRLGCVTLSLLGKLHGGRIGELRREIMGARRTNHHVIIDLTEVTLVDRPCVRFLAELEDATVVNCPEYIRPWLGRQTPCRESNERHETP